MTEPQLIYIAGPGHSGSTLLDILLGRHPRISALGEIHRFCLSLHRDSRPHRCDCGEAIWECPFWQDIIDRLCHRLGQTREGLRAKFFTTDPGYLATSDDGSYLDHPVLPARYMFDPARVIAAVAPPSVYKLTSSVYPRLRMLRRIAVSSHLLYDIVRVAARTPVVVDSTKNPIRLRTLYRERPREMKVLYMIRDGRAVTHSRMMRDGVAMRDAARIWKMEHWRQRLVQQALPREKVHVVKYEELCRNPQRTLSRVLDFIGVCSSWDLLCDNGKQRHAIGGNPMRFRSITSITLDDKWRSSLSAKDIAEFDRVAGAMNARFGYPRCIP